MSLPRKNLGVNPFHNSFKKPKYLGINLSEKMKDLYNEKFKTLEKAGKMGQ